MTVESKSQIKYAGECSSRAQCAGVAVAVAEQASAQYTHIKLCYRTRTTLSSRQPNQRRRRRRGRGRAVHARDCGAVTTASIPRPLAAKVACTIVVRPLAGHAPSCLSAKVLALLFRSPSLLGTRKRSARETPAAARTSGVAAGAGGAMPYTPGATTGAYAP